MRNSTLVRIGGCIIALIAVQHAGRTLAGAQMPCTQVPSVTPCLQLVPAPKPIPTPSGKVPAAPPAGSGGANSGALAQPVASTRNLDAEALSAAQRGEFKKAFELYLRALATLPVEPARPSNYWRRGPQPDFWNTRDRRKKELMTKIIYVSRQTAPAPGIPDGARRTLEEGKSAMRAARSPGDYQAALAPYSTAADLAPWWGAPHLALSIVWEALGNYTDAVHSLELYFLTSPNVANTSEQRTKMLELKRKQASS